MRVKMEDKGTSIPKITRPKTIEVFPRERLFQLLDYSRKQPFIWLTDPTGSGKTTLIASYLEDRKPPCLWYQLDQSDSDITSFFHYFSLAAKKAITPKKDNLSLLKPEYIPSILTFTFIFWGSGKYAEIAAGYMKHEGELYVLIKK